ncbi:MAG: hypothetical protein AAGA58_03910 [Verrucomicrobiota bacterium]
MKLPEQGITEGFVNPWTRVFLLFVVSYFVGIFYPLPEKVFFFIKDWPLGSSFYPSDCVDFHVLPFLEAPFSVAWFIASPISFACIVCSAMDRWTVIHTTSLGAASTFSLHFAHDLADLYDSALAEVIIYAIAVLVLFLLFTFVSLRYISSDRRY